MSEPDAISEEAALIRLRDDAVVDDVDLAGGYPVENVIRRVGQLG